MTNQAPIVDDRTANQISLQVRELIERYTGYGVSEDDYLSKALIGTFARFSEIIIQRLNRVPDKAMMAFLDLLGASRLPPQSARAMLTFALASGATSAVVPAGTQVAAPPGEGEDKAAIFETESELVVTEAQLAFVWTREPEQDKYADYGAVIAATGVPGAFVFQGTDQIEHALYIGHNTLLGYANCTALTLHFELGPKITKPDERRVQWEFWDNTQWVSLTGVTDNTKNLTANGTIVFENLGPLPSQMIHKLQNRWLRGRLLTSITLAAEEKEGMVRASHLPQIEKVTIKEVKLASGPLLVEKAFANLLEIDLSQDFFPFGEMPRFGDAFYLTNNEAFSMGGGTITLNIELTNPAGENSLPIPPVQASDDLVLQWEFGSGAEWIELGKSTPTGTIISPLFTDGTKALTTGDKITFKLPEQPGTMAADGTDDLWVRARIVSGNYGQAAHYVLAASPRLLFRLDAERQGDLDKGKYTSALRSEFLKKGGIALSSNVSIFIKTPAASWLIIDQESQVYSVKLDKRILNVYVNDKGYQLVPANFAPPSISAVTVEYSLTTTSKPPEAMVTHNDFEYETVNCSFKPRASSTTSSSTPDFEYEPVKCSFMPFQKTEDEHPALYLGFTTSQNVFPNQTISLFFQLAEVIYEQSPDNPSPVSPPHLEWEYWNGSWTKLTVLDQTRSLTRSGLIQFLAPADFTAHQAFDQEHDHYWLRICHDSGAYQFMPQLQQVLLNTISAVQVVTLRNDILGSSDGSEDQTFYTTHTPVLLGQQLEVREPEMLSVEEQTAVEADEGMDTVSVVWDKDAGRAKTIWVRWHQVPDFYGSKPRERHYVFNHLTGEVRFGNGLNGLIPSAGSSIRLARYQIGGGVSGNKPANTIVQLKTTVPYVAQVSNSQAAAGGADAQTLAALIEHTPRTIRHRQRAVTIEDYQDLALLASPKVARVKCVPLYDLAVDPGATTLTPGVISLIVVPRSESFQPIPSHELIRRVQEYLDERRLPNAELVVVAPDYICVNVTAEIAPLSLEGAKQVQAAAVQSLARFLHPLTGGAEGTGWDFGRKPHESDLYALLEAVPGVDYVRTLEIEEEEEKERVGAGQSDRFLVYSGTCNVSLYFQ